MEIKFTYHTWLHKVTLFILISIVLFGIYVPYPAHAAVMTVKSDCSQSGLLSQNIDQYYQPQNELKIQCHEGFPVCCEKLGRIQYKRGNVIQSRLHLQEAKYLYEQNCYNGDILGCVGLGLIVRYTEGDFLKAKELLERACYYFENIEGCESLARLELEMGGKKQSRYNKLCNIIGAWCDDNRGELSRATKYKQFENLFSNDYMNFQRVKYNLSVQGWLSGDLVAFPLEMEKSSWGTSVIY
jgi:hypothetical protein